MGSLFSAHRDALSKDAASVRSLEALAPAIDWIRQQANAAALGEVVHVQPLKLTPRSTVLRVVTSSARLFFKAGEAIATLEAPLTAWLSRRHPPHFAPVIACDAAHGWMLMREIGGLALMSATDVNSWRRTLETLGRIQCGHSADVDDLFELGCRQRSMSWLGDQIDDVVELWCGAACATRVERDRVRRAAPIWKQMCGRTDTGLPDATLDHIDPHPRNILVTAGGPVFLDWDGGGIGHPFWAPLILLGYGERLTPRIAECRDELRDCYLRPWTAYLPMTRLADAFEHARPLASLKYAVGLARGWRAEKTGPEEERLRAAIETCLDAALEVTTQNRSW